MKKNSAGVIVSVTKISEVGDSMVHCGECGKDFISSLDCDVSAVQEKRDGSGEMPLQCEGCFDDAFLAQGIAVVDMSRPDGILIKPAKSQPNRPRADQQPKKWWEIWKKV